MAKSNKEKVVKVDFATFRASSFEGVKKEEFLKSQKGIHKKQFSGYDDAAEREEKFLNAAWDAISEANKKEAPAKGAK